jgi:hypothetical protein
MINNVKIASISGSAKTTLFVLPNLTITITVFNMSRKDNIMNKKQQIQEMSDILRKAYEKCDTDKCPQEKTVVANTSDCAICEAQELYRNGFRKSKKG